MVNKKEDKAKRWLRIAILEFIILLLIVTAVGARKIMGQGRELPRNPETIKAPVMAGHIIDQRMEILYFFRVLPENDPEHQVLIMVTEAEFEKYEIGEVWKKEPAEWNQ